MFLVILTTFLTPISILASWNSIHHRVKEFFIMLLMLEVGIIGVFLSLDLFLFFLFWEIMLIPMSFLIGIWGHERRIYAAVKFILYTMVGSILMLVGISVALQRDRLVRSGDHSASPAIRHRLVLSAATRKCCSSWRSSWPSPSRCRSSRCTPGCPTRTSKLPPPAP